MGHVQNWLPAVAAITVLAVFIVSGLVFWQRSRRSNLGVEGFHNGQVQLAQGQVDQAIMAFRNALAHTPKDVSLRAALGLALVQSGHFEEAESYLSEVVKIDPQNGPVWSGLSKIALDRGEKKQALELLQKALAREWPAQQELERRNAQLDYAKLLSEAGRRSEAIPLLLSMIEQHGDDPNLGKKAAAAVKAIGSPEQVEEAYASLASHFPGDAGPWLKLGDVRFAAGKDTSALDAYRHAATADPENPQVRSAVARVEEVLRLDPTTRGVSIRARGQRWDEILKRVLDAVAGCASSPEIEKAKLLLNKRANTLSVSDEKMDTALAIWKGAPATCKTDAILTHILSTLGQ